MKSNVHTPAKARRLLQGLAFLLLLASLVALARWVRTHLFSFALVHGESMIPTLHPGDVVLINKQDRHFNAGDIISFTPRGAKEIYVKRLISAEPGSIFIEDGIVFVDGKAFPESTESPPKLNANLYWCQYTSIYEIGAEQAFVMGDNRCASRDSRHFGAVPIGEIHGKVVQLLFRVPF